MRTGREKCGALILRNGDYYNEYIIRVALSHYGAANLAFLCIRKGLASAFSQRTAAGVCFNVR